jgi:hypothetical protein
LIQAKQGQSKKRGEEGIEEKKRKEREKKGEEQEMHPSRFKK